MDQYVPATESSQQHLVINNAITCTNCDLVRIVFARFTVDDNAYQEREVPTDFNLFTRYGINCFDVRTTLNCRHVVLDHKSIEPVALNKVVQAVLLEDVVRPASAVRQVPVVPDVEAEGAM